MEYTPEDYSRELTREEYRKMNRKGDELLTTLAIRYPVKSDNDPHLTLRSAHRAHSGSNIQSVLLKVSIKSRES